MSWGVVRYGQDCTMSTLIDTLVLTLYSPACCSCARGSDPRGSDDHVRHWRPSHIQHSHQLWHVLQGGRVLKCGLKTLDHVGSFNWQRHTRPCLPIGCKSPPPLSPHTRSGQARRKSKTGTGRRLPFFLCIIRQALAVVYFFFLIALPALSLF